MNSYKPAEIEERWQNAWEQGEASDTLLDPKKPRCYVLDMFPYPSGASMHVGHPRGYVATDVYSRFKRMNGFNVLHPMGWDAFGLPAEETAIANKEYPSVTVQRNIARFKQQLKMLGLSYDWKREIDTTDPGFYKHTQRIFLEFFRRGLAYNSTSYVNWCPGLGTVLANEDIVDGKSERGGYPVVQEPMRQWTLRITAYADRLISDLNSLPLWPEKVKNAQVNWIGRSEGHRFSFATSTGLTVPVFTTKIETLYGVTFIALAPDSPLTAELALAASNRVEIATFVAEAKLKTSRDRTIQSQASNLIIKGVCAINPATGLEIPVVISEYVLAGYGTGAIMGVPGHDERDAGLAESLDLPIRTVVDGDRLVSSGPYSGLGIEEARAAIANSIGAQSEVNYKIRDWVFSRQRFWGEPFPIVWVKGRDSYDLIAKGAVSAWLPDEPVRYEGDGVEQYAIPVLPEHLQAMQLPVVASYEPTGTTSGPLAAIEEWVHVEIDPVTGRIAQPGQLPNGIPARRETNTMPQWAGSSWYWLRYMDPTNEQEPFSKAAAREWGPVSIYAGADHAVAHLIYARFWHKVMFDSGMVDFPEPFTRLEFLGYILASDGSKISKRRGNSRSPDDVVAEVGADAFRLYEMAIGPFEKSAPWSDDNLVGYHRFLERVWRLTDRVIADARSESDAPVLTGLHKTIQKVGSDIEGFKFNTAVASLTSFLKDHGDRTVSPADLGVFIQLLAPFAPHVVEEIWSKLGHSTSIHLSSWPKADQRYMMETTATLAVQVNGRVRAVVEVQKTMGEADVRNFLLEHPKVKPWIGDREIDRFVYVPGRAVNIGVKA